jgi:hypothetical protein
MDIIADNYAETFFKFVALVISETLGCVHVSKCIIVYYKEGTAK